MRVKDAEFLFSHCRGRHSLLMSIVLHGIEKPQAPALAKALA